MKLGKISSILALVLVLLMTGCSSSKDKDESVSKTSDNTYPITIKHAFGETVIESKPERIVSIAWGNQDVPLALGIVPNGVSKTNYGISEDEKLLPWTKDKFKELGVDSPIVFDDTDSLDFEAISDAKPDVILAAYSGITQEDYDTLSKIAPVVAYPDAAYQTSWRDQITINATGMGMKDEGDKLVADLEKLIKDEATKYPQIKEKVGAFFYFDPTDLGKFYVYTLDDPRAAYLEDLGLKFPQSVTDLATDPDSIAIELSAENADKLKDIDVIISYGDESLLAALQADPLLGTIPAIKNGAVVFLGDGTLAASSTPSALSIPATINEYMKLIGDAANKVK